MPLKDRSRDTADLEPRTGWNPPLRMARHEAISWLVQFANTDLDALGRGRPGDLANLLWDLRRFVMIVAPGPIEDEIRLAEKDRRVLKPAIDVARGLVDSAVSGKSVVFRYRGGEITLNAAGRGYSHLAMPLEDAVLFSALDEHAIDRDDIGDQIKRCKECSRVFAASRKDAVYCGRECANASAMRAFRERHRAASARTTTKQARTSKHTRASHE